MAKSKTTFKPGQSGNPNGRPKLPEDIRKASQLTNEEFIRLANRFFAMSRAEIQETLQDPKATLLELIVGGIAARAAKDNDHTRATFLLDRTIGKVAETIKHGLDKSLHLQLIEAMEQQKRIEGSDV